MPALLIEKLPYSNDSTTLFSRFLDWNNPVYLDSGAPHSARGRYDIFSAEPEHIVTREEPNSLISSGYDNNPNLFSEVKEAIKHYTPAIENDFHLPFIGGAIGYFGYDLGRQLEQLDHNTTPDLSAATTQVGVYSWAVIVDHRQQQTLLVCHPKASPALVKSVRATLAATGQQRNGSPFETTSTFSSNMSRADYNNAFNDVQRYIQAGDCYQINLAQRFSASYSGDPWRAYLRLRKAAAAPFSAFIKTENSTLLSLSPERFIQNRKQRVSTAPIKGTIARGQNRKEDEALAQQLLSSAKDRAENLMIVDLLRNDLGKSCLPGTIEVDELFELQSFETVHHLVSTISGQLRDDIHPLDLLSSCFPGGSITGAPKIRAMEIIEELEPHRRSAYCGAIGYISCDGQMDTNIAIRTLLCNQQKIHCWAGGGIVADSNVDSEYQECMTKIEKLLAVL